MSGRKVSQTDGTARAKPVSWSTSGVVEEWPGGRGTGAEQLEETVVGEDPGARSCRVSGAPVDFGLYTVGQEPLQGFNK